MSKATFTTRQAEPKLCNANNKWAARFEMWAERNGEKYMTSLCTSGAFFDTPADADEAGKRACAVLEQTGKFPNMCEKF